jgi:hypothetical protein
VLEQKRRRHLLYRVAFLVPTHRLAEEASSKMLAVFGAHGISSAIYQSREAKDLKTGEPLCQNLEAVRAAQSIGADVQRTCCKKRKIKCRFFDDCAFQRQHELANKADVVFAAHELMFVTLNRFGKDSFGLVIIDEGFSLKGILQDARQTRMKIDGLADDDLTTYPVRKQGRAISNEDTKQLGDISKKLQAALMQMPDGRLTRLSWSRKSGQDDKWNFCLTAAIIAVNRRSHEQTTPPEPLTGLQGEGGAGCHQGRSDDSPAGRAFRRSSQSDHSMEIAA